MDSHSSEESDEWISDDEWSEVSASTRRRLLQSAFGGAAMAGLAGCMGGDGGDGTPESTPTPLNPDTETSSGDGGSTETEETTSGESQYVDNTLDHIISLAPTEGRFNPYGNSANFSFRWYWAMFDQWAVHDKKTNKTKGMILKDWTYNDDGSVVFKLRDSYTWHDGSDLTADDAVTQLKIGKLMQTVNKGYGAQPVYENVQKTGKYELQFDLTEPDISREIFEFGHLKRRGWFWAHRDIWGEFADLYDDASGEKALNDARAKMQQTVKRPVWDNSQVPGNSIWEFVSGEENVAHMEAYDDYYSPFSDTDWAGGEITGDQINYKLDWHRYPNQQQRTQAMTENIIDVSYPPDSQSARDQLKKNGWTPANNLSADEIVPTMRSGAMGILFNCQSDLTGDPRVRKAIYHVVPRKKLVEWVTDYQTYWIEDQHVSGLGQDKEVPWFGGLESWPNSDLKKLEQYAHTESDVNTEKATQLLEDAGWSKNGGRWKDSNGHDVTLRFYTATSGEEPMALRFAQIAKSYLDKFGLKTEVTAQEATIRAGKTMESGDWELMFDNWGGAKSGPAFLDFNTSFKMTKTVDGQKISTNQNWAMQPTVEVPYPIGNPDGDTKKVNVRKKLQALQKQMSDSERQKAIAELAWIYNQTLPMMQVNEEGGRGGYWLNRGRWNTKPPMGGDNPAYRYEVIEVGQYSYAQYMAKFGTEYLSKKEK